MSVTGEGKNIKRGEFHSIGTHAGWHVRGSILAGRTLTEDDWKPRSMTRVQLDVKYSRRTASVSLTACLNGVSERRLSQCVVCVLSTHASAHCCVRCSSDAEATGRVPSARLAILRRVAVRFCWTTCSDSLALTRC
jgi:hypothetical protein